MELGTCSLIRIYKQPFIATSILFFVTFLLFMHHRGAENKKARQNRAFLCKLI